MKHNLNVIDCACFNIRRSARMVAQYYDQELKESGLKNTQFSMLVVLTQAGEINIGKLADILGADRTTITRNLQLTEREGLINISTGEDARSKTVKITHKGKSAFKNALPLWEKAQSRFIEEMGNKTWPGFLGSLRQSGEIAKNLQ